MKAPKSLAEFKRNAEGYSLVMTKHEWSPGCLLVGVPRVVVKLLSNGLELGESKNSLITSYLDLPRASEVTFGNGPKGSDYFTMKVALDAKSFMAYRVCLTS